jgi:hypothetical protein
MRIVGRNFEFIVASDVDFDGIRLELAEIRDGESCTLADVSFSDVDHTMTVKTFEEEVPVEAIEALIAEARLRFADR